MPEPPTLKQAPTRIIAIYGPTAVGKSRIAVEVAKALSGEIISADSMQVYEGIPIITDQPSAHLLATVPHHLVGFTSLDEEYSAALFAEDAATAINDITARNHLPIIVGGTGLYIRSLIGGFSFAGTDETSRQNWEDYVDKHGIPAALTKLKELDPQAATVIDGENPRRLIRALEAASTGEPVTAERERLWSIKSPYQVISFALETERKRLNERIDDRVDHMLAGGVIEEVKAALTGEISRTASQAIGLQEIRKHLDEGASIEDTAAAIKQKSRNYAKRQLTWMRKMSDVARIDVADRTVEEAAAEIVKHIQAAYDTPST
jgi:tRNA dimethylallyltransferase